MITQKQPQSQSAVSERESEAQTAVGFAVLGCLGAGVVGILQALEMKTGMDVLLCLLGSVAAFSAVYYMCFRRD
jgi:uncharacterized membrane protein YuzA (DUF378 family)